MPLISRIKFKLLNEERMFFLNTLEDVNAVFFMLAKYDVIIVLIKSMSSIIEIHFYTELNILKYLCASM